jgi:nucleotide-binding universal stress UspA family protein
MVGAVRFDPLGDRPHQFAGPGHHAAVIFLVSDRPAQLGADILVMGAYGHPRLWEFCLRGTTETLLERATIPVLMSH